LRGLSLPRDENEAAAAKATSIEELKTSIATLDQAIEIFSESPIITDGHTIDARVLSGAAASLNLIIQLATAVRKDAHGLAQSSGVSIDDARIKSRLLPRMLLQFTLDCNAWSASAFLSQRSETSGRGTVDIANFKAQTVRHKLEQPLILNIDECISSEPDEGEGFHFAAIVKDYISYGAKTRVFAYQVTYEIGLMKDGKITKRYHQPLSFYYVDSGESAAFELFRGPVPLGLVPDWAKEVTRKVKWTN